MNDLAQHGWNSLHPVRRFSVDGPWASGKAAGGTARAHEQLKYAYDAAGNLAKRTNNALVQTFGVNSLNELTTVGRSGTYTVAGAVQGTASSVTVNGSAATLYADQTFARASVSLTDGTNTFTALAQDNYGRQDSNTVSVYLPASVAFVYDGNGNLRTNGTRILDYDDENQLIRVTEPGAWQSEFVYDGKMRRRLRREYVWQTDHWTLNTEVHYVYDGNLVIQERHYTPQLSTNHPQQLVTYTRGLDLSGSLEGAGGIGGLLARTESSSIQHPVSSYYHSDGNGNITCLLATNQAVVARYLYDSFGNLLAATGPLAEANLYRFSSKEWHQASGLVYYLYRYYDPSLQRWVNRDPMGERGGMNLYSFVKNQATTKVDPLGFFLWDEDDDPYVWIKDKDGNLVPYSAACLANAKKNAIDCLKAVANSGGINLVICVVGCLPTLTFGPPGYYICLTACLGLDAAVTLYGIGACLDEYNKAKDACRPCRNPNDGKGLR